MRKNLTNLVGSVARSVCTAVVGMLAVCFNPIVYAQSSANQLPAVEGSGAQEVLAALIKEALREHPAIKSQRSQRMAAQSDLETSKWARFPSLTVEAQADENSNDSRVATLSVPVWAGGRIDGQISLTEAQVRQASAGVESAEQQVILQTALAFFEVLRLKARLAAAEENLAEHEKLLDLINRRVGMEVSPETDKTLAVARYQLANTEKIQVKRTLESAEFNLNQLVGRPVASLLKPEPIDFKGYDSIEKATELALQFAPTKKSAVAQADAAAAQLEVARAQRFPILSIGYQQVWQTVESQSASNGQGVVSFQFQPGAGLSSFSSAKAAEMRRVAAVEQIVAFDRQVSAELRVAFAEFNALRAQTKPAQNLYESMQSVVESYLRQYQIGRKTWIDVLNVQREKITARSSLSDVLYALESAKIKVMILTGELNARTIDHVVN